MLVRLVACLGHSRSIERKAVCGLMRMGIEPVGTSVSIVSESRLFGRIKPLSVSIVSRITPPFAVIS